MSMPDTASVRCSLCGASFPAEITTVVDGADAQSQSALLSGRMNVATCPSCGTPTRVATPLMYFDLEREVALVLVPNELGLKHEDQERAVGRLTNSVVDGLRPEQRKMYLLQPRLFFSERTFLEAVLEATGVDAEQLRAAQETATLIESLVGIGDRDELRERLEAVDRADDTSLVTFAALLADEAAAQDDGDRAQRLAGLRDMLIDVIGPPTVTLDDLVRELRSARSEGELDALVAAVRPALSYEFFAALTERIESADGDERVALQSLRDDVLAALDAQEQAAAEEMGRAARRLEAALLAPDPAALVREQADTIDETFVLVTEANLRAAAEGNMASQVAQLEAVLQAALEVLEERLPPEARLVNRLARATSDEEIADVLDASSDLVGPELGPVLSATAARARSGGADDVADALESAAHMVRRRSEGAGSDAT